MNKDQSSVILDRLDQIQKTIDRIQSDMDHDRKDLEDTRIRLGAMEAELSQLRDNLRQLPMKVANKVGDAVEPITKTLNQVQRKPFWEKLRRR